MNILVVVAHPDDEVLGCGGTIAKHVAQGDQVFVISLGDGETSRQGSELKDRDHAFQKSCQTLKVQKHASFNFQDNQFDSIPLLEIIQKIERLALDFRPEVVYTHSSADLNVDHRVTHQAVMTIFRGVPGSSVKRILTFEVPSSSEWGSLKDRSQFVPHFFVDIGDHFDLKMKALGCYQSEMREFPHPRSPEYIDALSKVRGGAVGLKRAEAFVVERLIES